MLDLFGILFSSIMMFLVILRAIQLDSTQPWFPPPETTPDSAGPKPRRSTSPGARWPVQPRPTRRE